jgi:arylsulfatase A-like enzyme
MVLARSIWLGVLALSATVTVARMPAAAQQQQAKPNIVVIMGDDIGMWNIGAYHRGLMAGRTPNLDKIAAEGMLFTDYYAEASCTAGRANFITTDPHRDDYGWSGRCHHRNTCAGRDDRRSTQGDGVRHRSVRQEPPRRP